MTGDTKATWDLWGQQALEVQTVLLELPVRLALLAVTAQTAWLGLLVPAESPELQARLERQARTARLVRRGVPEHLAQQALRVL